MFDFFWFFSFPPRFQTASVAPIQRAQKIFCYSLGFVKTFYVIDYDFSKEVFVRFLTKIVNVREFLEYSANFRLTDLMKPDI